MLSLAYIQVSRVCNQSCKFCSNPSNGGILPLKEAKRLIDSYKSSGYSGVIFTGGEPTMHPQLCELAAYCASHKLAAGIITNGQLAAEPGYLKKLKSAGLRRINVSVYSHKAEVQGLLCGNKDSLAKITRTLENSKRLGLDTGVNIVINRRNEGHLSQITGWILKKFPHVRSFVFNNLDPLMIKSSKNMDLVPRLWGFEVELYKALVMLEKAGKSFRVERVPLCFMTDFAHVSTETISIVNKEKQAIYFLDEKKLRERTRKFKFYEKNKRCKDCSLDGICAGLYGGGKYYDKESLSPVFVSRSELESKMKGQYA